MDHPRKSTVITSIPKYVFRIQDRCEAHAREKGKRGYLVINTNTNVTLFLNDM